MEIITAPPQNVEQPPLLAVANTELTVAISSLSLGGAEQIVLDWAARVWPRWKVHLIVLRDRSKEWPVPPFVHITRLGGTRIPDQLKSLGQTIAAGGNPVVLCHLLTQRERDALKVGGAQVVPVLHNAKAGWLEDGSSLEGSPHIITVSEACAQELRESGYKGVVSVIRHIPRRRQQSAGSREELRRAWNIPTDATVIGMVGAVKPQKNYPMALRILKHLLKQRDVYLVILGGPVNTPAGRPAWEDLVAQVHQLGIRHRVAMPGFVPDAAKCLPAFDLVLNTSLYEGLSIATLEALVHGLPVVASKVGGQGELNSDGLTLVQQTAPDDEWVTAIEQGLDNTPEMPAWADFPAYRMWTLAGLARQVTPSNKVLFVTANLNSGGAQRSLVNLTKNLQSQLPLSVAVAGVSTDTHFWRELAKTKVPVFSCGNRWDAFTFAETLVAHICEQNISTVCFWNTDARVKLLVAKSLARTNVRLIDVSPGNFLYGEMDDVTTFQELIAFTGGDYWHRLDKLVLKYHGNTPAQFKGDVTVIPNGVPLPGRVKSNYAITGAPRIVVNGRIAPTKFILEIIQAMRIVRLTMPLAQLHIFGAAEYYEADYAQEVLRAAGDEADGRIIFHGARYDATKQLAEFDAFVVLGKNQGCPNALLEALAAGVPAIANDEGGTREQLVHERTGLLVPDCSPQALAQALLRILRDRKLARRLGLAGRLHVRKAFSVEKMAGSYLKLLQQPS